MTKPLKTRAALSQKSSGRLLSLNFGVILLLACDACDSARKASECKTLVEPMNSLSAMLAATRGVLSAPDVQPAQVADALRPFSEKAKRTAQLLETRPPTQSALRRVSKQAADAATALSRQSANMADYARQMVDMDAANQAVEDGKRRVDQIETQIKQFCEDEASKCVQLSEVLARFPAPSDQNGLAQDIGHWTRELSRWTTELDSVAVQDPRLRDLSESFKQKWQEVGSALTRLVTILEVGKKYEELNKQFNSEIERANRAIANVNAECQSP